MRGGSRKGAGRPNRSGFQLRFALPESRQAGRERALKTKYGLAQSDVDLILKAQGGGCAICRGTEPGMTKNGYRDAWNIDHDHETGQVRGVLCRYCNFGLGNFRDNTEWLSRGIAYLRRYRQFAGLSPVTVASIMAFSRDLVQNVANRQFGTPESPGAVG